MDTPTKKRSLRDINGRVFTVVFIATLLTTLSTIAILIKVKDNLQYFTEVQIPNLRLTKDIQVNTSSIFEHLSNLHLTNSKEDLLSKSNEILEKHDKNLELLTKIKYRPKEETGATPGKRADKFRQLTLEKTSLVEKKIALEASLEKHTIRYTKALNKASDAIINSNKSNKLQKLIDNKILISDIDLISNLSLKAIHSKNKDELQKNEAFIAQKIVRLTTNYPHSTHPLIFQAISKLSAEHQPNNSIFYKRQKLLDYTNQLIEMDQAISKEVEKLSSLTSLLMSETNLHATNFGSTLKKSIDIGIILSGLLSATTLIVLLVIFFRSYPKHLFSPMEAATKAISELSFGQTDYTRFNTSIKEINEIDKALTIFQSNTKILKQREDVLNLAFDELEEANKNLQTFIKVSSHDLKSPLRGIRILCQLLAEDIENNDLENVERRLTEIDTRTTRLEKLLKALLEYVRLSKGSVPMSKVNVSELVFDQINILEKANQFSISIETPLVEAMLNEAWFAVTVRNLIDNAIKHHDKDTGTIDISIHEEDAFIVLTVTDDGPGIPEQFQSKIFEPFQTLQPKQQTESSGMGLAILSKIVFELGGSIRVNSPINYDRGSRFTIFWPKEENLISKKTLADHISPTI